jgi:hypothetical protein
MGLSFYEPNETWAHASRWCYLAELLFLGTITLDAWLKVYYMGRKSYFGKPWQNGHVALIAILWFDFLAAMCGFQGAALLRICRPMLLVTRSREVRRVYSVVLDMLPKLTDMAWTLLYTVLMWTVLGVIVFGSYCDDFSSFPRAFISIFVLSSTENYPDIMQQALELSPFSALYFVSFLVVGVFFVMPLTMGVVIASYEEQSKDQVLQDLKKSRAALGKAFDILGARKQGMSLDTFVMLVNALDESDTTDQIVLRWMFELLDRNKDGKIDMMEFYNLPEVLGLTFSYESTLPLVKLPERIASLLQTIAEHRYRVPFVTVATLLQLYYLADPISFPLPSWLSTVLVQFALVLLAHDALLCVAQSTRGYWKSVWAWFDIVTLFAGIVAQFALLGIDEPSRVLRICGALTLFHVGFMSQPIRRIAAASVQLVPVLMYMCGFLTTVIYIYAILGMHLLPGVDEWQSFESAFLTSFQIVIGDWNGRMTDAEQSAGWIAVPFFLSFFVVAVMLVFNLVTALVINYYEVVGTSSGEMRIEMSDVHLAVTIRPTSKYTTIGWRKALVSEELMSLSPSEVKMLNAFDKNANEIELKQQHEDTTRHVMDSEERRAAALSAVNFLCSLQRIAPPTLSVREIIAKSKIFLAVRSERLANICSRGQISNFHANSVIVAEGSEKASLYLLVSGRAAIRSAHNAPEMLNAGQLFSEDTFLSEMPYERSLHALSECTVVAFSRSDVLEN